MYNDGDDDDDDVLKSLEVCSRIAIKIESIEWLEVAIEIKL